MLTIEDIDILIDALTAWESKGAAAEMMGELFGGLLCRENPEHQQKMEEEIQKRRKKSEELKKQREEDSVVIKSKLIQMKRGISFN